MPAFLTRFTALLGTDFSPRSYAMGLIATLILGGGSYFALAQGADDSASTAQTYATVERRDIVASVKATGNVTFANEQQLTFNQRGTVAKVFFKEGDTVTKGQIIAELDKTTVLADIRQAELSVGASSLQLQQLLGDKNKDLTDAQNTVNESERQLQQAMNDLLLAEQQLPNDLAAAERTVKEKESSLEQAELELEKAEANELQSLASTAQSILQESEGILDAYYSMLTMDKASRPYQGGYDIEIAYLLYKDPILKQKVEFAYIDAVRATRDMRETYGSALATERDGDTLLQALSDAQIAASAVSILGEYVYSMLQGATTDMSTFTVQDLDAARSSVSSNRTKASSLVSEAQTAQSNLAAVSNKSGIPSVTLKQKQDAVTTAKNSLTLAEENLKIMETSSPADLEKQRASLTKIQEDLASKQAGEVSTTTNVDVQIALKQNDIGQRAASLQKTRKTLEDYQLTAPFDGVIRRLDFQVGDNLLADGSEDKMVVLENPEFLIVTVLLDQTDVVRVQQDMPVSITLDALPDETFHGVIHEVNPTPVQSSGVVSYEVEVRFDTPENLTILSGMTATVQIETMRKENVLAVPNLSLKTDAGTTTVQTPAGNVPVETGATDGRYTEILSGVKEGDTVLGMNVSAAATTATATQGGIPGMGGGGGAAVRIPR